MTNIKPVKVPRELLEVRSTVLEDYVRNRLLQFIRGFGTRITQLAPELSPSILDRAVRETLEVLPLPDYGQVPVELLELQLVFRHDCLALGCTEPQCVLCQHNSQRRCIVNFNKKYLVNDRMVARCGAQIRIEVVDRATGKLYDGELPDVYLELFVLDGAAYDQRFLGEAGRAGMATGGHDWPDTELDTCALLANNKGQALIASMTGSRADDAGRLMLQTTHGRLVLPDVYITDSSEALLSGRKPPFRLVVRGRHRDGRRLALRHAVSEPFVVATRRVRASHKVEIPSMDDPVSKLDHMGRETVRKLADLRAAAIQAGMELGLEPDLNRIEKVGEFKSLALRAESDGHLRQQLQALLKLAKEKWDEAAEHAKRAVVPDNRMRAWYADRSTLDLGLLFPCRLGVVDLKRPEALLQRKVDASGSSKIEVITQQQQTPLQRDTVRQLLPQAEASWWAPGHMGWTIFPADTDSFEASSAITGATVFDLAMFGGINPAAAMPLDLPAASLTGAAGTAAAAVAAAAAAAAGGGAASFPGGLGASAALPPGTLPGTLPLNSLTAADRMAGGLPSQMPLSTTVGLSGLLQPPSGTIRGRSGPASGTAAGRKAGLLNGTAGAGLPLLPGQQNQAGLSGLDSLQALLQSSLAENAAAAMPGLVPCQGSASHVTGLNLATPATPTAASAAAATAVPAVELRPAVTAASAAAAVASQQQQQQATAAGLQMPKLSLPSPEELQAMMITRTLTDEVVAAIAAAYEANQCPPGIMAVLQSHMNEHGDFAPQQQSQSAAAVCAAGSKAGTKGRGAAALAGPVNSNSTKQGSAAAQAGLSAGVKRTYSAAAGSPSSDKAADTRIAAEDVEQLGCGRPASFSGAIDTHKALKSATGGTSTTMAKAAATPFAAAAAAGEAVVGRQPAKSKHQADARNQRQHKQPPGSALDLSHRKPSPFYEDLRRDSLRAKSAGGVSQPSLDELADAAAATAAAADRGLPVHRAAAAAAADDTMALAGFSGLPHGQSLDIPGLRSVYPSVLLDSLVTGTESEVPTSAAATASPSAINGPRAVVADVLRGAAAGGYHSASLRQQADRSSSSSGASGAAAAATAAANAITADNVLSPDMEVLLGNGPSLETMQINLKECPSMLNAMPSFSMFDSIMLSHRPGSGAGDMRGMSIELPSSLVQGGDALLPESSLEGASPATTGADTSGGADVSKQHAMGLQRIGNKQLQPASSGLGSMMDMGHALGEVMDVMGDGQQMQVQ